MHILFLSDNFPPEVNAPASRTYEHCREWVRAGHEVTVLTCAPNFPKGAVFSGYRNKLWQSEVIDGIRVIRVWSYITANEGVARRILDYLSFMMMAILAGPFLKRPTIVVGTSPQFFTACAAYAVSRIKRRDYVFELRDLWPESIKAVGAMKAGTVLHALEKLELFLYRKAARVVCVTNAFKHNLIERGVDADKIDVITNGVDMRRFHTMAKDEELLDRHRLRGKFVAGYIGTHGMAHALDTVLDAAAQMRHAPGGDRYRFLMLGDGAHKQALVERAKAMGLDNVLFVETVPKDQVVRYWSLLDAAIIHLRRTELFTTVIPSKMFEAMGMGLPLLHGVAGESAELVARHEAGLCFEPENSRELCAQLTQMAQDESLYQRLRGNGLKAAKSYDRSRLALEMLHSLDIAVNGDKGAAALSAQLSPSRDQQ